jgi:hypothetical protein
MILGLSTSTFTLVHVVLSLVAILSGLIVLVGMMGAKRRPAWTALFLATTAATSISGFFFPSNSFGQAQVVAVLSLAALAAALLARYVNRLAGASRWIYALAAVLALYLDLSLGIVQAFRKVTFLQTLAPTQSDPPLAYTQLALLAIFVVLGIVAPIRFRPAPPQPTPAMDIRRAGS